MKKLCVFTLYTEIGASSQYRAYAFRKELEKHFVVQWFPFWNDSCITKYMHNKKKYLFPLAFFYFCAVIKRVYQMLYIAPKSDVVFIQKACIPKIKALFFHRIQKKNVRIVFDVDDAVYLEPKDNSDKIAEAADAVICGNETLKQHYLPLNKNTIILPTVENTSKYRKFWRNTFCEKNIGWIGSKATVPNLEIVVDPINKIMERHPEVHFYIISNDAMDYTKRIKNTSLIRWDKNSYISDMSKFTVGIMPLKNTDYNHGKCGFKLIQCLNMKKPIIATGIGVNTKIVDKNGFLANTAAEWEQALEKLLFEEDLYDNCVKQIENNFFNKYHFGKISDKLVRILNG